MKSLLIVIFSAAVLAASPADDLRIWELGGMSVGVPYPSRTVKTRLGASGHADTTVLYFDGSYALADQFTIRFELPVRTSDPFLHGFKASGLFGAESWSGTRLISFDACLEGYSLNGDKDYIGSLGVSAAHRWGIFAALGRISEGIEIEKFVVSDSLLISSPVHAEIGPFFYIGTVAMIGSPVFLDYRDDKMTADLSLDAEFFLPAGFSAWVVPRYDVYGTAGFSLRAGIAWMLVPKK